MTEQAKHRAERRRAARRPRRAVVVAVAAVAVLAGASFAGAAVDPSTGRIRGCVNDKTGVLRVLQPDGTCSSKETPISWNERGVAGPEGPQGPTGPTGPVGPAGSDATFAAQACPAGEFVTGITELGELLCGAGSGGGGGATDADGDSIASPEDCDDTDPAVRPGIREVIGNGKDDDCDPTTSDVPVDADRDGFDTRTDCDDADPARHPGATEVLNDRDDDCDGRTDEMLLPRLVVNEVDYDQGAIDSCEFVELINVSEAPIVLDGLVLLARSHADGSEAPTGFSQLSGSIAPRQRAVAAKAGFFDGSAGCAFSLPPGVLGFVLERQSPSAEVLSDSRGSVTILDARGRPLDVVGWAGSPYFEGTPNTLHGDYESPSGPLSFSRVPDGSDTDSTAADFRTVGSSPGRQNPTG